MSLAINTIYNQDCLEGIKKIGNNSVSLIVSDPPYFLGMTHNGKKGEFVDLAICAPFYRELFREFKRVLKKDGCVFFFCDWRSYALYYPLFDAEIGASNLIVWDKISGPGNKYSFAHELMIFHAPSDYNKGGSNIWREKAFCSGAKAIDGEKIHPTQKPTGLITKIITENSRPNDLILDCFMGSGTTAISCINTGRNYIGFELDLKNFDIAQERITRHVTSANLHLFQTCANTGQTATNND